MKKDSLKFVFTVTNDLNFDQRMIRICSALSKEGYEVELVGRKRPASLPLEQKSFVQTRLSCFFDKGKLFYLEFNLRLFFFLLFRRFDGVCAIDLDTLLPAFVTSRLKKKVCVYDAHEFFSEVPEVVRRPLVKKIWEGVASFIIPRLNYCYTVCESLAEIFEKRYGTPFSVIRNVPDFYPADQDISPDHTPEKPIILYQGALNAGRGLEALILAMKNIHNAVLWLAGEGDLSDYLRKLCLEEGVGDRVVFWGYLRPQKLKTTTLKATLGVNLLENYSLNYYYSLANKCFDYIHAGIPSVNMDFPEYRKINEEFEVAILVKEPDPLSIQKAVQLLLEDKDLYESFVQNCNSAREVLNWEVESRKLLAFYQNIRSSNKI